MEQGSGDVTKGRTWIAPGVTFGVLLVTSDFTDPLFSIVVR